MVKNTLFPKGSDVDMLSERTMLADVIDMEYLQQLQDSISEAANITTIILDSSGVPITKMTNPRGICKLMRDNCGCGETNVCQQTQTKLCQMGRETHKPATLICPISGLSGTAVPIFLNEEFLGTWIIGQHRFRDEPTEPFERALKKAGMDFASSQKLLEDIPVFRRYEFDVIVNFMSIVTGEIVKLTSSNIKINEKNTQLTNLTSSLAHSMEALRAFADTPDVCIYLTDFYTGEIIMCNNGYASYFDKTSEEITGTYCFENFGFKTRCPFCPYKKLVDKGGNPLSPYTWENYFEKLGVYLQVTSRAVYWIDGRLVNMSVAIDITQRKKMEDELYGLAFSDRILQIPNSECMEQDMKENRVYEYIIAANLTDISRINNIFGRSCANALLRAVRDYILAMGIPNGRLYRGKLSDFCLLLKDTNGNSELPLRIAEKIHDRFKQVWVILVNGEWQNIFSSVNVCVLPVSNRQEHFFGYLYSAMEHCLDRARKMDGVVIFDKDTRENFHTSLRLELSLKNAVHKGMQGFYVVYQPIIDKDVAMWKGVEALCRWDSPEFGPVPPSVFIPMAEACGLINTIDLWVLEQSVKQVKAWKLEQVDGFILEVNLSPLQIAIPNLDKAIVRLLKKHDYPPEKLGLEITESHELNFSKHTMEAIISLSELGVVIVLDDFGTGYSSFNLLHKLPVKILKTDRTFITGMETDGYLQRLLCVMVSLAHGSDMKLVAEGVETDLQVEFLLNQGADFFQGYFFSRPLTVKQLTEKLDNFYYPVEFLTSMGYDKWDLSRLNGGQNGDVGHGISLAMYTLLNRCVREVFTNPNLSGAIDAMLVHIGEGLNICRAYVVLKEDDGTYSVAHEWCSPDIDSMKEELQHFPLEQKFPRWLETINQEGIITVSDVKTLQKDDYEETDYFDVKAFMHFPIWNGDKLYGYVEFHHCRDTHNWEREEVQMLSTLTSLVAIPLGRIQLQNEVAALGKMRGNVPKNINTIVYVSDLETNKILFTNEELKRMYKGNMLTSCACWEALQKRNERCSFCPIPYLLKNPGKNYQWIFFNEILGKRFRVQDSIIPWMGGKLAHLQYAVDITELED